jgi:hypothetical protein
MKITTRKLKLGWKYRKYLWKYRGLIRHRREIMGLALGCAAVGAGMLVKRGMCVNRQQASTPSAAA